MTEALPTLEFFVNYGCNAKCPFCFNPTDASPELDRGLPFEDLARRLYAGRGVGYRAVKFIGGEATLREDLPNLLRLARKLGYEDLQLTTNGIRLSDPEYARVLVESGCASFRFSLHGHTPELHDRLVAVPGALDRAVRGVDNLRALGARLGINYVLNAVNCDALPETLPFFSRRLKIDDVIVYFLRYQGFAALPQNKALLRLSMTRAAASVRAACARLSAEGRALPALIHFPPCAMPELAGRMLDWTREHDGPGESATAADRLTLPDGSGGPVREVTNDGKRRVAACAGCAYEGRCLGVEENYVADFGEAEFRPVALEAAP